VRRWLRLHRELRAAWGADTRGWSPMKLIGAAAAWETVGDEVGWPMRAGCYRLAESYRMKAQITGAILRGERS